MKPSKNYKKYVYWLTRDEENRLRDELKAQEIKIRSAKGVVCTPLDQINRISSVAPEVWDASCARPGSWYRASDKNGLYLIVSAFELDGHEKKKTAIITRFDFSPPARPDLQQKQEMIDDPAFFTLIPRKWMSIDRWDKRIYLRWANRMGSHIKDFDFLYKTHTANHANFINPRFFIRENTDMIPYSIDRTAHLCSCCLELFQVLGAGFPKKLVAPCPGAAIFARLEPDRYLLVERPAE